jgi:hypothetical protein
MDKEIDVVNDMIQEIYADSANNWVEGCKCKFGRDKALIKNKKRNKKLKITLEDNKKKQVINLDGLSEEEQLKKAKEIITEFIKSKKNKPEFNYDANKNTEYPDPIVIVWRDVRDFIKANFTKKFSMSSWKKKIKSVSDESKSIRYKSR